MGDGVVVPADRHTRRRGRAGDALKPLHTRRHGSARPARASVGRGGDDREVRERGDAELGLTDRETDC